MTDVALFYLTPNTTGGWVTFTCHLIDALKAAGLNPKLYKVGNRTEEKERPFGYGCTYRNLSQDDAESMVLTTMSLLVAVGKKFKDAADYLMLLGSKLVVHDPTELKNLPDLVGSECVVIRRAGLEMLPNATFIRHPYTRQVAVTAEKTKLAVSTARIDFDKNTTILLDANRLLEEEGKEPIEIRGFENRLYTKFKVVPDYPEWVQSVNHYPRDKDAAVDLLRPARYMPDMSLIKGDGGGTQYTFLEAWDAGAVPIIHSGWVRQGDDMLTGINCQTAESGADLAAALFAWSEERRFDSTMAGFRQLKLHDPLIIGEQYKRFLEN